MHLEYTFLREVQYLFLLMFNNKYSYIFYLIVNSVQHHCTYSADIVHHFILSCSFILNYQFDCYFILYIFYVILLP